MSNLTADTTLCVVSLSRPKCAYHLHLLCLIIICLWYFVLEPSTWWPRKFERHIQKWLGWIFQFAFSRSSPGTSLCFHTNCEAEWKFQVFVESRLWTSLSQELTEIMLIWKALAKVWTFFPSNCKELSQTELQPTVDDELSFCHAAKMATRISAD